jgi:hypothetical protein
MISDLVVIAIFTGAIGFCIGWFGAWGVLGAWWEVRE